jgi:hypothetical protein
MPTSDRDFCRTVCHAASRLGFELVENDTALGISFTWRRPDGTTRGGTILKNRQLALLDACRTLLPEIAEHIL